MADLEDIIRGAEVGSDNDNLAGTLTDLYYIDITDVADDTITWTDTDYSTSNVVDNTVVSAAITAGDLYKIDDVVLYSGSVDDEQVGEEGGRAWMHKLAFDFAKNTAAKLGHLRMTTNARLMFFVPCADGTIRIVGNKKFPAVRSAASTRTGKKPGDSPSAGNTQEYESYGPGPALIFSGTIDNLETLLTV